MSRAKGRWSHAQASGNGKGEDSKDKCEGKDQGKQGGASSGKASGDEDYMRYGKGKGEDGNGCRTCGTMKLPYCGTVKLPP